MLCFTFAEKNPCETRVALTPDSVVRLVRLGLEVGGERGLGERSFYPDSAYEELGLKWGNGEEADIVLCLHPPAPEEIGRLKEGSVLIGMLDPFRKKEILPLLAERKISAVAMEMIPRSTLAQKMDALSSQANLAGYYSVLQAATRLPRILPMMTTPAGTLQPARVFIIGVGVAGLQAIATAKRLGARVEAFDTRPVVEEQVKSLGAKFVKIDLGETGQTEQGYAKALTEEQVKRQQEAMKKICAQSDIVITTAKLFGRRSPTLVTKDMLAGMKPGSVVVDLAVETGGNVEGSQAEGEVITENGVLILGHPCLEGQVGYHASQMYASNLAYFLEHFWNHETKTLRIDPTDELIKGCLLTHQGKIIHPLFADQKA